MKDNRGVYDNGDLGGELGTRIEGDGEVHRRLEAVRAFVADVVVGSLAADADRDTVSRSSGMRDS
jgi:hypothetical protein